MAKLTHRDVEVAAETAAARIVDTFGDTNGRPVRLYAVPGDGVAAAYAVRIELHRRGLEAVFVDDLGHSDTVICAVANEWVEARYRTSAAAAGALWLPLFEGRPADGPCSFPWHGGEQESARDIPKRLIEFIGEDPDRGGLRETPQRFLDAWRHWTEGYHQDPAEVLKAFEDGAENYNELVLVKDIPVYSHCEHHLAPFFGVAHIGYIPEGRIAGLSKLARLVEVFARRLQVQERMTQEIADAIEENLRPKGVAVVMECRHMCMESRGIRQQGVTTTTSAMRGILLHFLETRSEFLSLIRNK